MKKRKVYILLTRLPNNKSKLINFFTGFYYTHTSIALDEDINTFYSFLNKGFSVEKLTHCIRLKQQPFDCCLYEIDISARAYHSVKENITHFIDNKHSLYYSKVGVVLSFLKIPHKRKKHYFCSQFVAEVLSNGNAVALKKDSSLYLPKDFSTMSEAKMIFKGDLLGMVDQYGLHQKSNNKQSNNPE